MHKAHRLLPPQVCEELGDWWLAERRGDPPTPNWDIASTCTVDVRKGMHLVEAKAHNQELKIGDMSTAIK